MMKCLVILILFLLGYVDALTLDTLWTKNLGGDSLDAINCIIKTCDNNLLICGETKSYGDGKKDGWLAKLDENGNAIWSKTIGDTGDDEFSSMVELADSSIILCGTYNVPARVGFNAWVVKIDYSGEIEWNKNYGSFTSAEYLHKIIKTSNGGFIACGLIYSNSQDKEGGYLLSLDNFGDSLWAMKYLNNQNSYFESIINTPDNGFLIPGTAMEIHWEESILFKVDSLGKNGSEYGQLVEGGSIKEIIETNDGNYILIGSGKFYPGWIKKINAEYETLWNKTFYLSGTANSVNFQSCMLLNENIVACGYASDKACVFIFNQDGDLIDSLSFGNHDFYELNSIVKLSDEKIIVGGISYLNANKDAFIASLSIENETSLIQTEQIENMDLTFMFEGNTLTLDFESIKFLGEDITIFNTLGKEVKTIRKEMFKIKNSICLEDLSKGVYVLKTSLNRNTFVKSFSIK